MATSEVTYLGELRTEAIHEPSNTIIQTDAPKDNQGKGEAFSPTDLVATSLASCMMTIMGIVAKRDNIKLEGTKAKVTKVMASEPRRISEIHIDMIFPSNNYSEKEKKIIEHAALTCPVAKSLNESIKQEIKFIYS